MAFKPSNFSPDNVPGSEEISTKGKYTAFQAYSTFTAYAAFTLSPSREQTLETCQGKNVEEHFKPAYVPF